MLLPTWEGSGFVFGDILEYTGHAAAHYPGRLRLRVDYSFKTVLGVLILSLSLYVSIAHGINKMLKNVSFCNCKMAECL